MMNPSSNVCKKCLIVGQLPINRCCAADPCYFVFRSDNISLDHSVLFHWSCLDGDNPSYIGVGVVHLCLCHVT